MQGLRARAVSPQCSEPCLRCCRLISLGCHVKVSSCGRVLANADERRLLLAVPHCTKAARGPLPRAHRRTANASAQSTYRLQYNALPETPTANAKNLPSGAPFTTRKGTCTKFLSQCRLDARLKATYLLCCANGVSVPTGARTAYGSLVAASL